ncbi:MAG: hypothetical protein J6Y90_07530 [Lachnospiraceae bacterium]|nr:hypothetical protein [Lachnospiraceae bacterium]
MIEIVMLIALSVECILSFILYNRHPWDYILNGLLVTTFAVIALLMAWSEVFTNSKLPSTKIAWGYGFIVMLIATFGNDIYHWRKEDKKNTEEHKDQD